MAYLADINQVLEIVSDPINNIGEQAGKPNLLEDIIDSCSKNEAFLFVEGESFTVLKPKVEDNKKKLLIWVAYSGVGNAYEQFMPFIEERATDLDVDEMEFWTAIEGINRYIEARGWQKQYTIWSKPCLTK